ncbi:MAG: lysophospholipid acyltransferase family protein [Polyangiaceae bacterium]
MGITNTLSAVAVTAKICFPTVADAFMNRTSLDACDERLAWWSRRLLDDAEVTLTVEGAENIPRASSTGEEPAFVIMTNHRSYYDIPTVFCCVPGRVRMIAKKELFYTPIFGRAMLAAGFIKIDRDKREKAVASLKESGDLLKRGVRVWIAPEGTRSRDGALGPFKSGGFHLAIDGGVPILPIALEGTERILSASSVAVQMGAHVRAQILPPIDAAAYGPGKRKELTADVRAALAHALGQEP